MKNTRSSLLTLAERQMQERRLEDAIRSFRLYLRGNPNDLRALLQVGICHLLNRSEGEFLKVHQRVRTVAARIRRLPDAVARMWDVYGSLAARVAAATVVFGALALPGMAQEPMPKYAAPPYRPTPAQPARPLYAAPPYRPQPARPSPAPPIRPTNPTSPSTPTPGNARVKPTPRPGGKPVAKPTPTPGNARIKPTPRPGGKPVAKPTPTPGNARIKPSPRPGGKPMAKPSPRPGGKPVARPSTIPGPPDLPVTKYGGPRFNP